MGIKKQGIIRETQSWETQSWETISHLATIEAMV